MSIFSRTTPKSPPPPPVDPGIAGYTRIILHHLDEGNKWQRVDPSYFLWLGRRSAEAACLLLLSIHKNETVYNDGAKGEPSDLPGLIQRLKPIPAVDSYLRAFLEQLRNQGNLGAHVRGPDDDPRPLVRSLAQAWAGLLRGIAAVPATPPVPWPSDLEQRLARLEAGGDPLSPEEQAARLQGEVNEKRTLQATLALVQADLAAKRQDIDRLQGELNVFRNGQRKRTWILRFALGALGVLAVGLVISCTGFGGAFGLGMVELGDRLVGMVAPSNSGQAQAVSGLTVADPGAALTSPPPAQTLPPSPSPGPVTTCPTGMARIAATTLRLGQPIGGRQDWPRPTKSKLPPLSVAAFCIDHEPVSAAEAAAVMQSDCSAPAEALRAATCVGRDAAETWCAEHHPGGRLPSLAEWEVVARLPEAAVTDVHSLFREWVSDRFPPAVLARADPNWSKGDGMFRQPLRAQRPPLDPVGNVLWGWNQQDPDNRYGNLGFRCAVTPK